MYLLLSVMVTIKSLTPQQIRLMSDKVRKNQHPQMHQPQRQPQIHQLQQPQLQPQMQPQMQPQVHQQQQQAEAPAECFACGSVNDVSGAHDNEGDWYSCECWSSGILAADYGEEKSSLAEPRGGR